MLKNDISALLYIEKELAFSYNILIDYYNSHVKNNSLRSWEYIKYNAEIEIYKKVFRLIKYCKKEYYKEFNK